MQSSMQQQKHTLMLCESVQQQLKSLARIQTVLGLLSLGMLLLALASCIPRQEVIPDLKIPHRVAENAEIKIYTKRPDGQYVVETVQLSKGWWIASPYVVEQ